MASSTLRRDRFSPFPRFRSKDSLPKNLESATLRRGSFSPFPRFRSKDSLPKSLENATLERGRLCFRPGGYGHTPTFPHSNRMERATLRRDSLLPFKDSKEPAKPPRKGWAYLK